MDSFNRTFLANMLRRMYDRPNMEVENRMDAKRVGALIANLRRSQGMTQQQLADRIGVTNRVASK